MKSMTEIHIPHDVVGDESVIFLGGVKTEGEYVTSGEVVLDYETSKAVASLTSTARGYISFAYSDGESVDVGSPVAALFEEWDENLVLSWKSKVRAGPGGINATSGRVDLGHEVQFSARAEALIELHGLDRSAFKGVGMVSVMEVERVLASSGGKISPGPKRSTFHGVERIVVVGANTISAEMIEDLIRFDQTKKIVGYVSDSSYRQDSKLQYLDAELLDFPDRIPRAEYDGVVLAMGGSLKSMKLRKKLFDAYSASGVAFTNVVSPTANVASGVQLGVGNIIESNVYIGPHTTIGDNNFISYTTVIGHHSTIGNHNLFAPGVTMAGLVTLGDECILPTGVNFIDQVVVGSRVVLPVGYNILRNLEDDTIVKMKMED
jgi:UDP-3-O-[3-hydroxymyristoyl] glucosamine N-acyltransferase